MWRINLPLALLVFLVSSSLFLPVSEGMSNSAQIAATSPTVDPALLSAKGECRVIATVKDLPLETIIDDLDGVFLNLRLSPVIFGYRFATGVLAAGSSEALSRCTSLSYVGLDTPLGGIGSACGEVTISRQQKPSFDELCAAICSQPPGSNATNDAFSGGVFTTTSGASSIIGSSEVWALGIDGSGITIAIIDTGVDFASPGLGYWNDSPSRDGDGVPSSIDADAQCIALTNTTLQSYSGSGGRVFIKTRGLDPTIYLWGYSYSYSEIAGGAFPSDMDVTGIVPAGRPCHFGVMVQLYNDNTGTYESLYPVLVVDKDGDSVFETAYVDLSSVYYPQDPDYRFSDESPLTATGSLIAARDLTHDGIFDISAGSLGRFLDVWGISPNTSDRGRVLLPIDPLGNYVSFIVDMDGHGSMCANTAAARNTSLATGVSNPYWFTGVAPGATIMSVTSLTMGDIIEGELWACGFDLLPVNLTSYEVESYGTVYGVWNYTGEHRADIVSNSWGISESMRDLYGYPWYSIICCLQDCLSIPHYIDPSYPGTLFLQSSGNGAPGYGTVTDPACSLLTLTVGATTSLNFSCSEYGFAGGYADEVIPWSGRGPAPAGYVKPDVVNVGMADYVPTAVNYGGMSGMKAYALFSGTSMSCPMTAGVAALVLHAYLSASGEVLDPQALKAIIKSSAVDLGYDAFLQGSGRVDCLGAVELALGSSGILLESGASYANMAQHLSSTWAFSNASLGETPSILPLGTLYDPSWFAGYMSPGSTSNATLVLINPTASQCEVALDPQCYSLLEGGITINGSTADLPEEWRNNPKYGFGVGNMQYLNSSVVQMPASADLMTFQLSYPFTYFDDDGDYWSDRRFAIFVLDWIDYNSDGECTPDEAWLVTYGENEGNSIAAAVSYPSSKFQGQPVVLVWQSTGSSPVPYHLELRFWSRSDWGWISLNSSNVELAPGTKSAVTATMSIPPTASQGVYEGLILANYSGGGSEARTFAMPVSVAVPQVIDGDSLAVRLTPDPGAPLLYDPYSVAGLFDWSWRYESGDWKIWLVELPYDPGIVAAFVICNWSDELTDIDLFSINSSWMVWDATDMPENSSYWRKGIFHRITRDGGSYDWVSLSTEAGIHTILLHNVLFGGDSASEAVEGTLALVRLGGLQQPLTARSGSYLTIPVNLSTGFRITGLSANLSKVGSLPSGVIYSITPSGVNEVDAADAAGFMLHMSVPSGAEDGSYALKLTLDADQFEQLPELPSVTFDLIIDNSPPDLSFSSPLNGSISSDALVPILINFSDALSGANTSSAVLSLDGVDVTQASTLTGTSILHSPESPLSDGPHTVSLSISDNAGNEATATWSFTIDTSPPRISWVSPLAASFVNSTIGTISAECYDPVSGIDPCSFVMLVDSSEVDATLDLSSGFAQHAFAGLPSGPHTVSLSISDNAGNEATATWSFTIDTSPPSINHTSAVPANNSAISGQNVLVACNYSDNYILDLGSISLIVDGTEYAANATATPSGISLNLSLQVGLHTVNLTISDVAGNTAVASWSFAVSYDPTILAVIGAVLVMAALGSAIIIRRRRRGGN